MENSPCEVYNDLIEVELIKTEPDCLENVSFQSFSLNASHTELNYSQSEEIFPNGIESEELDGLKYLCDMSSLPLDDGRMSSSDYECDIVNLNLRSSGIQNDDMLEIHSPESWCSSHHSLIEHLSVDSRPSTTNTLSTNPSSNEPCVICNDLASGKHYGVYACEGCKGFFKRTIRRKIKFSCRVYNKCSITGKLRNRCQACRFKKCLERGMKIEAVQKERPLKRKLSLSDSCCSACVSSPDSVITADNIFKNEMSSSDIIVDQNNADQSVVDVEETRLLCSIINKQLFKLVMWAKSVPGFSQLDRSDQMILLNKSWVDIFLASVAFRTTLDDDMSSIKIDETYRLTLSVAANFGLQQIVIRIIRELVTTFKRMNVDQMEVACLKIIILFDSNHADINDTNLIRGFRFSIFDILKKYIDDKYPDQPSRIHKLLLKLSSIRGLTVCFVYRMRRILHDCLRKEQSNSEFLFPLFHEMINQQDFPFS